MALKFQNPPKIKHITKLLDGVVLPEKEITIREFQNRDQHKFGAGFMIKAIKRILFQQ